MSTNRVGDARKPSQQRVRNQHHATRFARAATLTATVVVVVACGSSSDPPGTKPATTTTGAISTSAAHAVISATASASASQRPRPTSSANGRPRPPASAQAAQKDPSPASSSWMSGFTNAGSTCTELLNAHKAIVSKALAAHSTLNAAQFSSFGQCLETKGGSWAVVLESITPPPPTTEELSFSEGFKGVYAIVYRDPAGPTIKTTKEVMWNHYIHPEISGFALFDFDGDGSPEAWVHEYTSVHEGEDEAKGVVYTKNNGQVVQLPGAMGWNVSAMQDMDGDGRPDLKVIKYEGVAEGYAFPFRVEGLPLIAHSLAGGKFSLDDEVAKKHAKALCGASKKLAPPFERSAVCEQLWGKPAAQIIDEMNAYCKAAKAKLPKDAPDGPQECFVAPVVTKWLGSSAPLQLK